MSEQNVSEVRNVKQYEDDLRQLIATGDRLCNAIRYEYRRDEFEEAARTKLGDEAQEILDHLPSFSSEYQGWYSEARVLIRQLLPDRLDDFVAHYEVPKARKQLDSGSYRVADCLIGLSATYPGGRVVGPPAAIPQFDQQVEILRSVSRRFKSSLFDIRQLVQADLFDSELDAATDLMKHGFLRAAGALAGVVMEKHLAEVCRNHSVAMRKKRPGISDFNEALKREGVVDTPQWRRNQHLADLRNLCDHHRSSEPTKEQVTDLVQGVGQVIKTLF